MPVRLPCGWSSVLWPNHNYLSGAATEAGAAAEVAASRKEAKHADLGSRYIFEPIAVETVGVFMLRTGK